MTPSEAEPVRIVGFDIRRRIAQGGMATVYEAEQLSIGRTVALKVLRPRLAADTVFVGRFQREARAAAKLGHPNVVSAIDVGESGGRYYFVMEFVDGETVGARLRRAGPMDPWEAARIALQIARALEHAHTHGMVHLDVKPGNIMLPVSGEAKLADFGLARKAADEDLLYSERRLVVGTPAYMSPEQLRPGGDVDTRGDIYSLGVTFYEMVVGKRAFRARARRDIVRKVRAGEFDPVREAAPELPENIAVIIEKTMALDREDRYQAPRQLVDDLEAALKGEAPRIALGLPAPDETADEPTRERRGPRVEFVSLVVVLMAVVAVGALLLTRGRWWAGPTPGPKPDEIVGARYRELTQRVKACVAAGDYVSASKRCREFRAQYPRSRWAKVCLHDLAEVCRKAEAHVGRIIEAATRLAGRGSPDAALAQLAGLGPAMVGEAPKLVAAARRRIESAPPAGRTPAGSPSNVMTSAQLEERVRRLGKAGRYEQALRLCESAIEGRSPRSTRERARQLRGPLERLCSFIEAVESGVKASGGRKVRVGNRSGKAIDSERGGLRVRFPSGLRRVPLSQVAPDDLMALARKGWYHGETRLAGAAATYFARAGKPEEALRQAEKAILAGDRGPDTLELAGNLLWRLARTAVEAKAWDKAERYVDTLRRDPAYSNFVAGRRNAINDLRKRILRGRRYANMVFVPAGQFRRGGRDVRYVPAFYVDRHEVTVGDYARFVKAVRRDGSARYYGPWTPRRKDPRPREWSKMQRRPDLPVTGVDWYDAMAYARSVGKRLPREMEWEKAARGVKGLRYPWGNVWDPTRCNSGAREDGDKGLAPVGKYPTGRSPYGCDDMAGNAREWVQDGGRDRSRRFAKGGSYISMPGGCAASLRQELRCRTRDPWTGFRCAAAPEGAEEKR